MYFNLTSLKSQTTLHRKLAHMGNEMKSTVKLSKIGTSNAHGEDSPYFAGWKAYDEDPYDAKDNPSGVIQMGLAENQVSFDLLEEYLEQHKEAPTTACGNAGIPSFRENALYQDYHGLRTFREAMARFMEQIRGGRVSLDPDRIVFTAGATAANELLTFIIANPGEAILVPTPYYPGFDRDLRWRTGVEIVPIRCESRNGFRITNEAMEKAYADAERRGVSVRGLLLTNPSNPLGIAIERPILESVLSFAERKNIHVVSDEIYSGSVFSDSAFVSVAEVLGSCPHVDPTRVHLVYSLSKDLGLPGFRVGVIYSHCPSVSATARYNNMSESVDQLGLAGEAHSLLIHRRMTSFSLVSSQTQKALAGMLADSEFTGRYLEANRKRLRARWGEAVEGLRRVGVRCLEGNAGLFCWMDLGPLMGERTVEREVGLWGALIRDVKINVSPGSACHCEEAGWFRVCFANMSRETLNVALTRIGEFVEGRRRKCGDVEVRNVAKRFLLA